MNICLKLNMPRILLIGLLAGVCGWSTPSALADDAANEAAVAKQEEKKRDDAKKDEAKEEDAKKEKAKKDDAKKESDSEDQDHEKSKPADNASEDEKQQGSAATDKDANDKKRDASDKKGAKSKKHTAKDAAAVNGKPESEPAGKKSTKREKVRVALFTLKDSLPEFAAQGGLFNEQQLNLREAVNRLDKAAKDESITAVLLDIQNPSIGRGKVAELRDAIGRFRAAGKKVYSMLETAMPADYLVACAGDEIIMPETGIVVLPGIHMEAMFYKNLLGKLGIQADFIHIGPYKGAAEPLAREKFSEPVRENMNSLVDSLYDDMVTTIVKDRPISIAQAKEIIDRGVITAKRAKELGLIDRIGYTETLRDELARTYNAEPLVFIKNYGQKEVDTDFSGPMGFFKLMQAMMGVDSSTKERNGKKIAVVYAVGPIMTGKSESDMFGSQTVGSTTIVEALREANHDDDVAAIVLRVDSPGGSAIASDLIWHETQVIEKPIVASMGDVAASGGYYISMGADRIYAAPGTVTGSIGVVGGKLALKGLFEKIGVTTETISRGKNSGIFSSSGKFTESERSAIRDMMEDIYAQFTTKAAEGRGMELEKLRELAGGRVYTGRQAQENGLIDELGTLEDAIEAAKKLAGIDKDTDVRIEVLPESTNFLESLFGDVDAEKEVNFAIGGELEHLAPEIVEAARRAQFLREIFRHPAALVMPFELTIR